MNRTYRLVWNDSCRAWIPVGENARARGKCNGARVLRRLGAVAAVMLALPAVAKTIADDALPTGFKVVRGSGSDSRAGNVYTVTQDSQRGVFGFDTFDIGSAATVNVKQGAGAAALFVIGGSDASHIYGKFNADATVFLSNPNGMVFGRGAQINVGGMLATTMSMDAGEFMDGRYRLTNPGSGTIYNDSIDFKAAGSVALIANTVENAGKIAATTVTMAAGNTVAIDLIGNGLIRARVEEPALRARIVNLAGGEIAATVAVTLTAGQARDTLDRVVNNSGTIRATGLVERGGEILLEGGLVTNGGTLDASSATGAGGNVNVLGRDVVLGADSVIDVSGATTGGTAYVLGDMKAGRVDVDGRIRARGGSGDGGFIETSAAEVRIADSFRVDALSAQGRAGKWLIDPVDFYISAGSGSWTSSGIGATTLSNALSGADVTIETDNNGMIDGYGDIYVNSAVTWNAATTLTLNAYRHIKVNAAINATGNGNIKLRADSTGKGSGTVDFSGGGSASTNGGRTDIYYNPVHDPAGTFGKYMGDDRSDSLYNPFSAYVSGTYTAWMLVNTVTDLFNTNGYYTNINDNLDGYYALGRDIDFAGIYYGYGFRPIGGYSVYTPFTGRFDGLGHAIKNLQITGCSSVLMTGPCINHGDYVGLFAQTSDTAVIQNLSLLNVTIDTDANGGSSSYVGALVGSNHGQIINVSATGAIGSDLYTARGSEVGGLVGYNSGSISDSWADVDVFASNYAGGLVGSNGAGTIIRSHASGDVYGTDYVGGLAGESYGLAGYEATIEDSYAIGNVAGRHKVGGLVGYNRRAIIRNSFFASGSVWGYGNAIGGLVGENSGISEDEGVILYSYADGLIMPDSGTSLAGGLVGYNGAYGRITDSYSHSFVVSGGSKVGGLAGGNKGIIVRSYATGSVTGLNYVGGLVGYNEGTNDTSYGMIIDSYSLGPVEAEDSEMGVAGGLVGRNEGEVIRSYSMAEIVSAPVSGGLVGQNLSTTGSPASIQQSFWLRDPSAGICALFPGCAGVGAGDPSGATGLTQEEFKRLSVFAAAGWDIDDAGGTRKVWRIYDGYTAPLLRALLIPVTVTADDISKAYDGDPFTGDLVNAEFDPSGAPRSEKIRNLSNPYQGATAAGTYRPKLYSSQDGYDISYVHAELTIGSGEQVLVADEGYAVTSDYAVTPEVRTPANDAASGDAEEERKKREAQTVAAVTIVPAQTGTGDSTGGRSTGDADNGASGNASVQSTNPVAKFDKPADETVAPPAKPKGRMLVCRKG